MSPSTDAVGENPAAATNTPKVTANPPAPSLSVPAPQGIGVAIGNFLSGLMNGQKKLTIAGGMGALIMALPSTNPWVDIAKVAGLAGIAAVHNYSQSKSDQAAILASKPGFDYQSVMANVNAQKKEGQT